MWTVFCSEQTETLLLPMPISSTEGQGVVSCGLEMRSQNDDGAWALPRYEENGCESRTFLLEMCFLCTVEYDPSTTKQWALREKGPSLRTLQTCVCWQMHTCMVAHTLTHPPTHTVIYIWASWNSDPHGYSASMLPNEPSLQAFPSQLFLNCLPWKPSLSFLLGRTEKDIKSVPFGIRNEAYTRLLRKSAEQAQEAAKSDFSLSLSKAACDWF